jgi:hypothetical protein
LEYRPAPRARGARRRRGLARAIAASLAPGGRDTIEPLEANGAAGAFTSHRHRIDVFA